MKKDEIHGRSSIAGSSVFSRTVAVKVPERAPEYCKDAYV